MKTIIDFVAANLVAITAIQQGLFSALSLICQMLGWKVASKVFGTLTTLDLGRVLRVVQALKTPPAVKATLGGLACIALLSGCGASAIHPKIEQALLFEDQVHAQVKNLEGVFDATLLMIPEPQRPEWQARLAFAKQQLGTALEAKDAALRAALAASDSTVDISAVVGQIVAAVTGIVEIVDAMGASKPVVAHARAKAAALKGGL